MLYRAGNIFINGEVVDMRGPGHELLRKLANARELAPPFAIPPAARAPLHDWYTAGYIQLARP